jgi:DNA-binding transcriptional ArsR family regulator
MWYIGDIMTIFDALADQTRRQILELLYERPHLVGELVDLLKKSQPLISKHLLVLREAGLVDVRQDAQRRWYELRAEPLAEIDAWLAPFRQLLEARYARLDTLLEELQKQDREKQDGQE